MAPTTASDTAPAATSVSVVSKIPKSTAALATVMTLFAVALLAVCGLWTWKRRKAKARGSALSNYRSSFTEEKHVDLENVSIYMEKPEKPKQAVLISTMHSRDTSVGWVPQVRFQPIRHQSQIDEKASPSPSLTPQSSIPTITARSSVHTLGNADEPSSPEPAKKKKHSRSKPPSIKFGSQDSEESRTGTSPPPAYGTANRIILETEDSTPTSAAPMYLYPSPGLGTGYSDGGLSSGWYTSGLSTPLSNITITTTTTVMTDGGLPPAPLPSPRSESFNIPQILGVTPANPTTEVEPTAHDLPRLMNVIHTFERTLSDELDIKIGDTVRMIEEYRDEWCLVQHVGPVDAPRGVVPRFCLQERKRVIPGPKV